MIRIFQALLLSIIIHQLLFGLYYWGQKQEIVYKPQGKKSEPIALSLSDFAPPVLPPIVPPLPVTPPPVPQATKIEPIAPIKKSDTPRPLSSMPNFTKELKKIADNREVEKQKRIVTKKYSPHHDNNATKNRDKLLKDEKRKLAQKERMKNLEAKKAYQKAIEDQKREKIVEKQKELMLAKMKEEYKNQKRAEEAFRTEQKVERDKQKKIRNMERKEQQKINKENAKLAKKARDEAKKERLANRKSYSNPLSNALMGRKNSRNDSNSNPLIKQLYGNEFNTYSPEERKFIRENLGSIHSITQKTLLQHGYPEVAIQTHQEGVNVVSFDLHPNGQISNLRLERAMGYAALDQNTLDVIRLAYRNYPTPNVKSRIKFYVHYTLE